MSFQFFMHYGMHLLVPIVIALLFFRKDWKKAYFLLLATMLVDLDHLVATPIFEPNRCSVGFHYLHTYWAMIVYVAMLFGKKWMRILGIGLLFHMLTDLVDCMFMFQECNECFEDASIYPVLKFISGFLN